MIYEMLYPWQKKIVDKFYQKNAQGLFLDMGLGKTPLGLAFAEKNKCTKVIIITINSKALESVDVKGSWLNWASKSNIPYKLYSKNQMTFDKDSNELLIVNYESLFSREKSVKSGTVLKSNILNFIKSCKGHNVAIIVDESHKTKNLHSKQTVSIMKLQRELKLKANQVYTYLLTGTPFTTNYIDLYTQLKLLGHDGTKGEFVEKFCERGNLPGLLGWQQPIVGYKNLDKLYKLVHQYAITIKSTDVVELPESIFVYHNSLMSEDFKYFIQMKVKGKDILKRFNKLGIDLPQEILQKYNTNTKVNNPFFRNIAYPSDKWLADTSGSFWLRCRQLSIGFQGNAEEFEWFDKRRLNQLKKFLKENEDNYLLFYNYTPELLAIYDICEELKYNIDVYCGDIKSLHFYEKYSNSSESDKLTNKKNIILANFASGSTGMNWQEYNKCIIFSTPLYKDYEQGIKRIHRLGQTSTVVYHIFNQENWLDENMNKSLDESIDYSNKMFEDDLLRIQKLLEEK